MLYKVRNIKKGFKLRVNWTTVSGPTLPPKTLIIFLLSLINKNALFVI